MGHFVWYDLMTPDLVSATAFYTNMFGWGTRVDRPLMGVEGQAPYTMWTAGGVPFAGTVPFNVPYWLGYVAVTDVDRAATQAASLGGRVVFGPHEIARVGRFAVLEDPRGATFGVYRSAMTSEAPRPVAFNWHALRAEDPRTAFDFYAAMFGWKVLADPYGHENEKRVVFGLDGVPFGVIDPSSDAHHDQDASDGPATRTTAPATAAFVHESANTSDTRSVPPNVWFPYVAVPDLDEILRTVAPCGGHIVGRPSGTSRRGRAAQFCDPAGALLGARQITE